MFDGSSFDGSLLVDAHRLDSGPLDAGDGYSCFLFPMENPSYLSCTGTVVASGSMNNSDSPMDAARFCAASPVRGTCCMFHLYGPGEWYVTDGAPQAS